MQNRISRGTFLLIFLGLTALLFYLCLPALLETLLVPRLTRELPLSGKAIHIAGLSPWSLQGSIRLENGGRPVLTVSHFALRYSPLGLLRGKIAGIFLEDARLHLQKQADRIGFNGIPAAGRAEQGSAPEPFNVPLFLDEIAMQNCAIVLHESETAVRQLMFDARISLPLPHAEARKGRKPGTLEVSKVLYKGKHLLAIRADLELADQDLTVKGTATSPLAPDLRLPFIAVYTEKGSLNLEAEIPEGPFAISSLAPLVALPPDLHLNCRLRGTASISLGPHRAQGTARLQVKQGQLEMPEKKIAVNDINFALTLPELPLLHSSPDQLLSIEKIDIGDLRLSQTNVHFHLQDPRTILIEKARLAWCGGQVESEGLKLTTQMKELKTVLSCRHLDLSKLLSQIGMRDSHGQGSLDGRLPLTISSAGIEFDNGFLFSTPGEHGRLHLSDTETLRQGMSAPDTTATLDYAMDALKDFSYDSLRFNLNTTDNDLLITMQLDGKPAAPLPYGYKDGRIVKVISGPGLQHPIQLNVNFHLPSAEVFRFGKNIQSIRENI